MSKYYDLHVHTNQSSGANSVEEMAKTAEKFGWDGIAVCDHFQDMVKFKQQQSAIKTAQKNSGIEIFSGTEIQPKNQNELGRLVSKIREHVQILVAHGGDYNVNRAACQNPKVDILAHPELGRTDCGLDEFCLAQARENNVAIQINFREILEGYRKPRVFILSHIAENIRLAQELKAPVVACSAAQSIWDVRDPRALASIANVLGMELGDAINTVSEIPEKIVETNKAKLSGKAPVKGVEIVE
ncbi:MAG: RNase P subunit p30 family protein [Candidatus Aenigmatarchaeota archaeon]